ncbi:MAG: hypothetical protein HRU18_01775 [Pseudoalteromonas sp.]|uniref:hypothetical protein n=1 Tax=Pseudoalteromonas sp. TaxID=53249 RepID=UPI001D6DECF2|nr:hypothetical protein [Pseudoalteromonas sp.]NRA76911.1 hypothetical protein [Pseudoalteromonas sp.]
MEFKEFIKFSKNQVSDRLYKYATLFDSLCDERAGYEKELEIAQLELEIMVAEQRVLKRNKERNLSASKQSSGTEINDKVNVIKEIQKQKRLVIDIKDDLNRVKAEIEILKETRKNLEILANDNREERKGSSMSNRKGGHNE